jgi:hypothetical protein
MGFGGADRFLTSRPTGCRETKIITIGLHDPDTGQLTVGFQPAFCDSQAQSLGAKPKHGEGGFGECDSLHGGSLLEASYWTEEKSGMRIALRRGAISFSAAATFPGFPSLRDNDLTDGNSIDYEFVKAQIVEITSQRNLIKLFTDPYNAKKLAEELLNNDGLPVEYLRQGYLSLSDPTKTLHELIMGRKIRHGGNPVLRWHASNAVARRDAAGNVKLDKEKSRRKIDGMGALVNAIAGVISHPDEGESVYEHRGPIFL